MQRRNTIQKQLVLNTFLAMQCHATAEQVHAQIAKEYQSISLATVYRNLNCLAEEGVIKKILVGGGADRFDFQTHSHYHMHCRKCGRFEDAPVTWDDKLFAQASEKSGYLIEYQEIVFWGTCPKCRFLQEKEAKPA